MPTKQAAPMISFRLDDDLRAKLDQLAADLSERAHGATVTRSDAIRVAVTHGLEALASKKRKR